MFHTQLRAILRASHYGDVRILIPMISHAAEIDLTVNLIKIAKDSLRDEKIPFNERIQVGGMIEIPAAALSLGIFMRKLDFLSIGTNDLIQYTLVVDRIDDTVAHLYDPLHPAILWLLSHIIKSAKRANKSVSVCGEMAGDKRFTRLLLGLGLQQFSMYPAQVLTVKDQILKSHMPDIAPFVRKIIKADQSDKIKALLTKLNN